MVGVATDADDAEHVFTWSAADGVRDLVGPSDGTLKPMFINASGAVAGTWEFLRYPYSSRLSSRPFLYTPAEGVRVLPRRCHATFDLVFLRDDGTLVLNRGNALRGGTIAFKDGLWTRVSDQETFAADNRGLLIEHLAAPPYPRTTLNDRGLVARVFGRTDAEDVIALSRVDANGRALLTRRFHLPARLRKGAIALSIWITAINNDGIAVGSVSRMFHNGGVMPAAEHYLFVTDLNARRPILRILPDLSEHLSSNDLYPAGIDDAGTIVLNASGGDGRPIYLYRPNAPIDFAAPPGSHDLLLEPLPDRRTR